MRIFGEVYDDTLTYLEMDACSVFIPVRGGLYRAVFAPATERVRSNMRNDPVGFAIAATRRTREFARERGFTFEEDW